MIIFQLSQRDKVNKCFVTSIQQNMTVLERTKGKLTFLLDDLVDVDCTNQSWKQNFAQAFD